MIHSKLLTIGAIASAVVVAGAMSASAQTSYDYGVRHAKPSVRHARVYQGYRPLTVSRRAAPPVVVAAPVPPPYAGPATIVTGPVNVASAAVALPFRILGDVFPANANSPLVLIGGPIQAAGQIAQFPFRVVDAAFGAPYPVTYAY